MGAPEADTGQQRLLSAGRAILCSRRHPMRGGALDSPAECSWRTASPIASSRRRTEVGGASGTREGRQESREESEKEDEATITSARIRSEPARHPPLVQRRRLLSVVTNVRHQHVADAAAGTKSSKTRRSEEQQTSEQERAGVSARTHTHTNRSLRGPARRARSSTLSVLRRWLTRGRTGSRPRAGERRAESSRRRRRRRRSREGANSMRVWVADQRRACVRVRPSRDCSSSGWAKCSVAAAATIAARSSTNERERATCRGRQAREAPTQRRERRARKAKPGTSRGPARACGMYSRE